MTILKCVKYQTKSISVLAIFFVMASTIDAYADFIIKNGQTVTTTRILTSNQKLEVEEGGAFLTPGSIAILSTGNFVVVKNNGSISAAGKVGIELLGANNNNIYNNGSISAGANGFGIQLSDANNNIIGNYGSISVGAGGIGIDLVNGVNNIINNHGGIFATDAASFAIFGSTNDDVLNLFPGSQIIGIIDFRGHAAGDTVNIYSNGVGPSYTLELIEC